MHKIKLNSDSKIIKIFKPHLKRIQLIGAFYKQIVKN